MYIQDVIAIKLCRLPLLFIDCSAGSGVSYPLTLVSRSVLQAYILLLTLS
jgi:hypothetical protein